MHDRLGGIENSQVLVIGKVMEDVQITVYDEDKNKVL